MIYKYDKKGLTYKNVTGKIVLLVIGITLLIAGSVSLMTFKEVNTVKYITTETRDIILKEHNEFSPKKLREYIVELHIKFPNIVMAQAQIESGCFTSKIFKENFNMFGMKLSSNRPTTARGLQYDHAFYYSWKESVQDYAFYSASYLKDIHTENEYLEFLGKHYAEDPNYVSKIINIINNIEKNLVASK